MKYRQRQALLHPVSYTGKVEVPHKSRVEKLGQRITILTVSEFLPDVWVWQASISFGREPLGKWSLKRTENADKILRLLLNDVGEKIIFSVRPVDHKLDCWRQDGLKEWKLINDPNSIAHIHESLGMDLPMPPEEFRAMHMWKDLTDDELKAVKENLTTHTSAAK